MPAEYSPGLPANIGETDPAQFLGAAADYQSRETAALAVRTADGDKVRISFDAVSRIAARDDSAEGESSFSVQVSVKGTLDDNEVAQISELLRRLVTTSRSEEPTAIQTGGLESLDRFKFAYKAYERLSLAVPDAQMA